jgi:hypothetical protein
MKMKVCVLRKKARETDDGRTTDRPSLLFGHSVSPRTGTSQRNDQWNDIIFFCMHVNGFRFIRVQKNMTSLQQKDDSWKLGFFVFLQKSAKLRFCNPNES